MTTVTHQLDEVLRTEAEDLLHEACIWEFSSYGWLSADDVDPEFVGHAMWQTNAPLDELLELSVYGSHSRSGSGAAPQPPAWQRMLALEGVDFGGLMQAARMSIGLFLIQAKLSRDNPFNKDDLFDLHWMSSVVYLSTASERIRALFIAAAFRKSAKDYAKGKYNGQKRSRYKTPFIEAMDTLANPSPEVVEALAKAPSLADEICQLRDKRNELIHELATAIGQRERALLDQRPLAAQPHNLDFPSLQKAIKENEARHKAQLAETIKQLAKWYELLVRASNEVFIVEHYRRSQLA